MQHCLQEESASRAPLASFDTVDLGEDRYSKNSSGSGSQVEDAIISGSGDLNSQTNANPFDVCDSLSGKFHKFMNVNYKKLSDSGSDGNDSITKEITNKEEYGKSAFSFPSRSFSSDSHSDSSDSDSGYIRSGYMKVDPARKAEDCDSGVQFDNSYFISITDSLHPCNNSAEPTPTSSPLMTRSSINTLLGELQTEKIESKRKALEKKIQRLQVTNTPVQRPRSTTPINVHTFDEYKEFQESPEKSPCLEIGDKIRIKLPGEEFSPRHKSPRRVRKASQRDTVNAFNFSEDHLFSRTKSAVVIQNDGSPGPSPRRILLPPTLTPKVIPPCQNIDVNTSKSDTIEKNFHNTDDKWIAFDKPLNSDKAGDNWFQQDLNTQSNLTNVQSELLGDENSSQNVEQSPTKITDDALRKSSFNSLFDNTFYSLENSDDILTVNINEIDGKKICDVKCEHHDVNVCEPQSLDDTHDSVVEERLKQKEGSFDLIEEIEKEMQVRHKDSKENQLFTHTEIDTNLNT